MKKIESLEELNSILKVFEGLKYDTNAYFFEKELLRLIHHNKLFFKSYDKNLLLYVYNDEVNFYEVYYYIKDRSIPVNILDNSSFVMEIPYRGAKNFPIALVEYWNKSGFENHINRDLLGLNKPDVNSFIFSTSDIDYLIIDDIEQVGNIYNSIRDTFDLYTGDILTIDEVRVSIENKEIVGAYKDGNLAGFIKFYEKNKVSWIGHLVVFPEYGGNGIGKNLVGYYLTLRTRQGFNNFQQWVISNNKAALKLYNNFGFKFTNKNSISLLKI